MVSTVCSVPNAALIGISGFGRIHYDDLLRYHQLGRLRLRAATVINQEQEVERCAALRAIGCTIYADYHVMLDELAEELDLCFIPTGIAQHKPMALEAMRRKVNCLIEKPAAPTVQDVRIMREAERRFGVFAAVGFQAMYRPELLQAKERLLAGKIGRIHSGHCIGCWSRDSAYYRRNAWAGRIGSADDGWILDSPFQNGLAHYLNLLLFLPGKTLNRSVEPESMQALLLRGNPDIENCDTAALRLKCRDGIDLRFCCTHATDHNVEPEVCIHGENGSLIWRADRIDFVRPDGSVQESLAMDPALNRNHLMDAVLDRLHHRERFICSLELAEAHVAAVNAAQESVPVQSVPESRREELGQDHYRWIIPGIEEKLRALLRCNDWEHIAEKGKEVRMSGYSHFPGPAASV